MYFTNIAIIFNITLIADPINKIFKVIKEVKFKQNFPHTDSRKRG